MSKRKKKSGKSNPPRRRIGLPLLLGGAGALLIAAICLFAIFRGRTAPNVAICREKLALLEAEVFRNGTDLGKSPAGGQAGYAVFFSLSNTEERASVLCATGGSLRSAWDAAADKAEAFLDGGN